MCRVIGVCVTELADLPVRMGRTMHSRTARRQHPSPSKKDIYFVRLFQTARSTPYFLLQTYFTRELANTIQSPGTPFTLFKNVPDLIYQYHHINKIKDKRKTVNSKLFYKDNIYA